MSGSDSDRRRHRSLLEDERAIEGLPIRLVIALVVGVAALGIMMQILSGFGGFGPDTEVTVEYANPVVTEGDPIEINVTDETGEGVVASNVIVRGGTLNTDGAVSAYTGDDSNQVSINFGSGSDEISTDWRSNQDSGKLRIEIIPPSDGSYVDDQQNPEVTVLRSP